jgi:gamma-glutamylcyclotransferase (GGCT)/AIG2-like uncharacterized protein YtfP
VIRADLGMSDRVFFYGTLRAGFARRSAAGVEAKLTVLGRGSIAAALYDLGPYPAAIPHAARRVWGEMYRMREPETVLAVLDEIEGCHPAEPDRSLYVRAATTVTIGNGEEAQAWVYFYNAPLGRAVPIESGDYLEYVRSAERATGRKL